MKLLIEPRKTVVLFLICLISTLTLAKTIFQIQKMKIERLKKLHFLMQK